MVAPTRCRNGHALGPLQVLLGTELCEREGRYRRHTTWTCRTKNCGDVIIADGHPDGCRATPAAPQP